MGNDKTDNKTSPAAIIKKIQKKRDAIKSDDKSVNLLLDILKHNQSKNADIVVCSCNALGDVFSHLISSHKFLVSSSASSKEGELSKEEQFSQWLREQFTMTCDLLCEHLVNEATEIQTAALEALVVILQAGRTHSTQPAYTNVIESMMSRLVNGEGNQGELIQQLPTALAGEESHTEFTTACLTHAKKLLKHKAENPSDNWLFNYWQIVKNAPIEDTDDKSKRLLTGVVCDFLKRQLPSSLYREILTGLSTIMEKMSSPIRLADFLSESFNLGGAISLLSLNGLFILMHKYNLDYPDFYNKLYAMFEPQVFSAKYRARFFHLAETFLSSTHLPAYLVCAFAKRLSRLALHAPAPGSLIAVPFILNLLHRHPECQVLLHRTGDCADVDSDPFLPEETDTAKCKAADSCLWELQTLESHYNPSLSLQAKKRSVAERDLGLLLENTSSDIITSEAKKVKSEVAVTFVKPGGLELPNLFVL